MLRRFEGGSFAETLLLEEGGRHFVRKRVAKDGNLAMAYQRLRDQFRTLERFAFMDAGLVPALLGEENNSHEYFYDMEFLGEHGALAECAARAAGRWTRLFDRLGDAISIASAHAIPAPAEGWLLRHFAKPRSSRRSKRLVEHEAALRPLLAGRRLSLTACRIAALEQLLAEGPRPEVLAKFAPKVLSLVHGDLTFQNIMLRADGARKLIDMEAQDGLEATGAGSSARCFQSVDQPVRDLVARSRAALCPGHRPADIALTFSARPPPTSARCEAMLQALVAQSWAVPRTSSS